MSKVVYLEHTARRCYLKSVESPPSAYLVDVGRQRHERIQLPLCSRPMRGGLLRKHRRRGSGQGNFVQRGKTIQAATVAFTHVVNAK